MKLRRYLVCYDVGDPKRLRSLAKCLESFGDRIQYSVFICDLPLVELNRMKYLITKITNNQEDSVIVINLGVCRPELEEKILLMGKLAIRPNYVSRVY